MSKKSQSASAPAAESPKPVEIPNPDNSPAVVMAKARYDALTAKLAGIRSERRNLEQTIGVRGEESDDDLEAKLLARGLPSDDLNRLRELRRIESVTEKATLLLRKEVAKERETAARELTAMVREEVFLPGVKAAIKDWLETVVRIENFHRLVDDIQAHGVGSNTFSPFNVRVPLSLADRDATASFVRELIGDGFTDADTVNAILPGLV